MAFTSIGQPASGVRGHWRRLRHLTGDCVPGLLVTCTVAAQSRAVWRCFGHCFDHAQYVCMLFAVDSRAIEQRPQGGDQKSLVVLQVVDLLRAPRQSSSRRVSPRGSSPCHRQGQPTFCSARVCGRYTSSSHHLWYTWHSERHRNISPEVRDTGRKHGQYEHAQALRQAGSRLSTLWNPLPEPGSAPRCLARLAHSIAAEVT